MIPSPEWDPALAEYHASPEIGSTMLRTFVNEGVAAFRAEVQTRSWTNTSSFSVAVLRALRLGLKGDRSIINIGSAVHCRLLEGAETFNREFVGAPPLTSDGKVFDRRQKKAWKKLEDRNPGKTVLAAGEFATATAMCGPVLAEPNDSEPRSVKLARAALTGAGASEYSYRWQQEGVWCKCRFDRLFELADGRVVQVELKTTIDPRAPIFSRHYRRMGWHLQAALYNFGAERLLGRAPDDVWCIAIRRGVPFDIVVHRLGDEDLEKARAEVSEHLASISRHMESGDWFDEQEKSIQNLEL